MPRTATALKRWIRTDRRWKRKALSRWSVETWVMRLPKSPRNCSPTLFIITITIIIIINPAEMLKPVPFYCSKLATVIASCKLTCSATSDYAVLLQFLLKQYPFLSTLNEHTLLEGNFYRVITMFMMMMMMMRRFVKRVLNSPQRRCQSIKQVALEMSDERQRRERCGSKGSWQTVPDAWASDRKTPHPQCCRRPRHE